MTLPTESLAPGKARPIARADDGQDPPILQRARAIPHDLARLALERARAEAEVSRRLTAETDAADTRLASETTRIDGRRAAELSAAKAEHDDAHRTALATFETDSNKTKQDFQKSRRVILGRFQTDKEAAEKTLQQARWEANTVFEASSQGEAERFANLQKDLDTDAADLKTLHDQTDAILGRYRKYKVPASTVPTPELGPLPDDPHTALRDALTTADSQLLDLQSSTLPRFFAGPGVAWLFVVPWLAIALPAAYFLDLKFGLAGGTILALAIGFLLRRWIYSVAGRRVARLREPLLASLATSDALLAACRSWADEVHRLRTAEIKERREKDLQRAEDKARTRLAEVEQRRAHDLPRAEQAAQQRLTEIQGRRDREVKQADDDRKLRLDETEAEYARDSKQAQDEHQRAHQASEERYQRDFATLSERWLRGIERIQATVAEVRRESGVYFPSWESSRDGDGQALSNSIPPVLRFGELTIDLAAIPHGPPRDDRLRSATPTDFSIPALLPFPDRGSLLIPTAASGRAEAVRVVQAVMLRYLTGMPAGKVRFTIIDPVELGRNFSGFMHLADHSEALVNNRIWTEPSQIDQRLAELSLHVQNVLQNFLRNEYETLEDYNAHAGEVAEPYRVLVIADFPTGFSEDSIRRLASLATSGARCGVHILMTIDPSQPLPAELKLKDFEAHAATLIWKEGRFLWKDRDFEPYPLQPDAPPPPETFTSLLQVIGRAAWAAHRVEVPFEVIAPPPERYWLGDSRAGIDVPLGRSGATKLQHLELGRGTSQHVLIAGRTGSGKSTLLHALIVNSALIYSPDQLELYLIDFKKGVEFKTYATHALPHARVVAIESEREFGLSVLQRLDEELKVRGDIFRDQGVQDLNGYRSVAGLPPMPRILLIVDEFQEFFVDDDKLAQEAALMLDRIVRQGRAFGIHAHLGSQTLSGAYSLARSTLGQMAVRIALQCSEGDAHLILSEENSAARLLSRPGEAIYNDANGMTEGNHIFQVVWLPDERREVFLKQINDLSIKHAIPEKPRIVFEGNRPADLRENPALTNLLDAPTWPEPAKAPVAWLGDAVAIKDPTAAIFRRQGGNHLLSIGQDDEAARGLFAASLLGLAAQFAPADAQFAILDGTPEDSSLAGFFRDLVGVLPHPTVIGGWREASPILGDLAAEVDRRQSEASFNEPARFLLIYDLARFRDLRRSDDDFGFSRRDDRPASPSEMLGNLLREGPGLGIHVLVWCDTLNNVGRSFDRQALREFEQRVLFQMSPGDSSQLIDSPAASKLGANRALYASEEQNQLEKFRPYGLPPRDWLDEVRARFRSRPVSSAP